MMDDPRREYMILYAGFCDTLIVFFITVKVFEIQTIEWLGTVIGLDEVLSNNAWVTKGYFIFLLYADVWRSRDMGRVWRTGNIRNFLFFR